MCYIRFAPLPCACEVDDAVDDEKISEQNMVSFSVTVASSAS